MTLLLERGADPNKKDSFYGATPFNWAANEGHVQVARLLIDKGAPGGPALSMRRREQRQHRARGARA